MKRTPLIPTGGIFQRETMVEIHEADWPLMDDIKGEVVLYDEDQDVAAIWDWPSAKFVRLKPGDAVVYEDEDGFGKRYIQR